MMSSNLGKNNIRTTLSRAAMLGWCIWKARNEFIFQSLPVVAKNIALRMEQAWEEFNSLMINPTANASGNAIPSGSETKRWKPPEKGKFKFNCDASWNKTTGEGFGAVVLRNHTGDLVDGKKFKVTGTSGTSALACEAMALREACFMAAALKLQDVQIESDNKELISLSVSELDPPWDCACIIQDIRKIVKDFHVSVSWIPRSINCVAHWVASVVSGLLPQNWVSMIPAELSQILLSGF